MTHAELIELCTKVLLQSTAVLAAGLIGAAQARRFGAGAATRSAMLRATLVALIACPLAAWGLSLAGARGVDVSFVAVVQTTSGAAQQLTDRRSGDRGEAPADDAAAGVTNISTVAQHHTASAAASARWAIDYGKLLDVAIVWTWAVIATILLLRLLMAHVFLRSAIRRGRAAEHRTIAACRALADAMNVVAPPMLVCDQIHSPCLTGWRRPTILLPNDGQRITDAVLAHELAHLRRGDCVWHLAARLTCAILWFQPLAWLLARRIEQAADEVCDDFVVHQQNDRAAYADDLVKIAERFQPCWPAVQAGVGVMPFRSELGRRVSRIMDSRRSRSTRVGSAALLLVTIAAIGACILGGLLGVGDARSASAAEATAMADQQNMISVKGRVLDPSGKPLANARVTLAPQWAQWDRVIPRKPLAETTTDAAGRFATSFDKSKASAFAFSEGTPATDNWKYARVIAAADGFGIAWAQFDDVDANGDVVLKLAADQPIEGRVIDPDGKGVGDVKIIVDTVAVPDLDKQDQESKVKAPALSFPRLAMGIPADDLKTDADGKFTLKNMGRDRKVFVQLSSPKIVYSRLNIVAKDVPTSTKSVLQPNEKTYQVTTYGAKFEFKSLPARPVAGVVKDAETGKPIPNVFIACVWIEPELWLNPDNIINATSDENGQYVLDGLSNLPRNRIIAVAKGDATPYFFREITLPAASDPKDVSPLNFDIDLYKGVWIKGKVTDKVNGKPVAARIGYSPYKPNDRAAKLTEVFDDKSLRAGSIGEGYYSTQADGSYRIPGVPGKGVVWAQCWGQERYRQPITEKSLKWLVKGKGNWPNLYSMEPTSANAAVEVDVPANGADHVDMQLDPGATIAVTAIDADGKPIEHPIYVGGQQPGSIFTWGGRADVRVPKSTFNVSGMGDEETRRLTIRDDDRKLGIVAFVKLADAKDGKLALKLEPIATASGRVIDPEGKPIADLQIEARASVKDNQQDFNLPQVNTDADGKFTQTLLPGAEYHLWATGEKFSGMVKDHVMPKPGQAIDLGDIKMKPKRQRATQ